MPLDTSPLKRIMDPASSTTSMAVATATSSLASSIGALRDGWTGISEALSTPTAASMPTPSATLSTQQQQLPTFSIVAPSMPLTLNTSGILNNSGTPTTTASTPIPNSATGDLLELTTRLTRQLKRAEETCRRIEVREKNRVEVLKRCLIACCAKESAEVLEMALEIATNEDPEVERDSREFKELLIIRSKPDEQIEAELDRIASLERELKEERAARNFAEEEKAIMEARLKTQEDAWQKERERYVSERTSVEDLVKERLAVESETFTARIKAIEQTNKDRMQLETARLHEKIRTLESRLEMEASINRQRKELEESRSSAAAKHLTNEKDEEIEHLRQRIQELEDSSRPQRELMNLVKSQAQRERVVASLENEIRDLRSKCNGQAVEIEELTHQLQGAVPSEYLGPARGDYLRHVIFKYLTFENISQKQALIPVIAMLLNFNPEEKKICESSAARDAAKEGIIGSLASSFQSIPAIPMFATATTPAETAPRGTGQPRLMPAPTAGRYVPVATQVAGVPEQNGE